MGKFAKRTGLLMGLLIAVWSGAPCRSEEARAEGAGGSKTGRSAVLEFGERRELFVDHYLIDKASGCELRLHHPVPREVVLAFDKPWEGNFSHYVTVFRDEEVYRMYYRGAQIQTREHHGHTALSLRRQRTGNDLRFTRCRLILEQPPEGSLHERCGEECVDGGACRAVV